MRTVGITLVGLILGLVACFLKPGGTSTGWIMIILLGIGGVLAALYDDRVLGLLRSVQGTELFGAVLGALVLLVLVKAIRKY